jgi:hypothetical protein
MIRCHEESTLGVSEVIPEAEAVIHQGPKPDDEWRMEGKDPRTIPPELHPDNRSPAQSVHKPRLCIRRCLIGQIRSADLAQMFSRSFKGRLRIHGILLK